jgi:hypothetical protein
VGEFTAVVGDPCQSVGQRRCRDQQVIPADDFAVHFQMMSNSNSKSSIRVRLRWWISGWLELSETGQANEVAAEMCGLSRGGFLFEAGKLGIAVAELSDDELSEEFV